MTEFERLEHIAKLLVAKKEQTLNSEEKQFIDEWLQESDSNQKLLDSLMDDVRVSAKMNELANFNSEEAFNRFLTSTQKPSNLLIKRALRVAAVLFPILFGIYFLLQNDEKHETQQAVTESRITPGYSRAILQLSDGTIVDLENEKKQIANENGAIISNTKKELIYQKGQDQSNQSDIKYNNIEIPRGGEYQLTLSDGTRVWLNSETSLRYPVFFSGKTRELQLVGEAYFEVAENKEMPFIVRTTGMDIHVTGTKFNVRAYSDEKSTVATLVDGSVNISQSQTKEIYRLKPGQQAMSSGLETKIENVNIEQFIAWKNGRIYFENNSLDEILSTLSRWYNVEVNFSDDSLKELRFSIDVKKYTEFDKVFEIVELTKKVKFSIDRNRVTVLPVK